MLVISCLIRQMLFHAVHFLFDVAQLLFQRIRVLSLLVELVHELDVLALLRIEALSQVVRLYLLRIEVVLHELQAALQLLHFIVQLLVILSDRPELTQQRLSVGRNQTLNSFLMQSILQLN